MQDGYNDMIDGARTVSRLGLTTVQTALGITGIHELGSTTHLFRKLKHKQMELDFASLLGSAIASIAGGRSS